MHTLQERNQLYKEISVKCIKILDIFLPDQEEQLLNPDKDKSEKKKSNGMEL